MTEEHQIGYNEKEFRDIVKKEFSEPIFLGITTEGERLFLQFDLTAVAVHPGTKTWRVVSLYFIVNDQKGNLKFTLWKQPEIHLYKENSFSPKVEAWMIRKFKLAEFNNSKVSNFIRAKVKKLEDRNLSNVNNDDSFEEYHSDSSEQEIPSGEIPDQDLGDLKEFVMENSIQIDALSRLLIEKGIITAEELADRVKQVQAEYKKLKGA